MNTNISIEPTTQQSPLTLHDAQIVVDEWIQRVGVRYFSELTNLAQLVEEVGEVARLMSRTYGDQSEKTGDKAGDKSGDAKTMLADELADVLFVLICIANQTGVDLTAAFRDNLTKKTRRDGQRHQNNPKLTN